ncbi:MAG: Asp-tRNA(Asn)/Glu-tRNA(Gln) amidotransferase subunit GatB [Candidatus Hydrogenedentes bacterium]|nr:Asp-tRNA(Asn)/Glu-tRNA(Gln) amidotransferase subunit GatB [Candidatus Hydrogenedentota bacterium]
MDYEPVIGMEVHVELATRSKVFCGCSTEFGGEPNTHCCPICLGMPGVLPVLNRKAVDYVIRTGLALNCKISSWSKLDRKNYWYPDLPKNYQISQYDLPIAYDGYLDIEVDGVTKRVGIPRVHIEEDAGKNIHPEGAGYSQVDLNRTGVPLMEIVTEPDIRSADEARAYLQTLKNIIEYIGVSDCNMEEGSLRAEANISIRPVGATEFGVKTEVKNVNSFRGVNRAVEFEIRRQKRILESGDKVEQETRGWDGDRNITVPMRSKESAHDYRYFPEPDLVPLDIDADWIERIRAELPEMPTARRRRFVEQYGLPDYDAAVLTATRPLADFYERCAAAAPDPKSASNWIMGELQGALNDAGISIDESPVTPEHLAELLVLVDKGSISGKMAKDVFRDMFETGRAPNDIVAEKGLSQISDRDALDAIVEQVIEQNPEPAELYRGGKKKALGFLVGQVMKATQGKANPQLINELFREKLGG